MGIVVPDNPIDQVLIYLLLGIVRKVDSGLTSRYIK